MKKFQSIGTLLSAITLLLVVLLVSVFTYSTEEAYARRADAARLLKTVDVLRHVYLAEDALHNVQGAMSTALAVSTPLPMGVKSLVTRLDRDAESAMAATRDSALLESDGRRNSSWTRIHDARRLYQERYREAMLALDMPRGRRRQNLARDWTASVNHVAATINLRTRQRSMDIADSSAFNNEMTKIIRIAWAIRDTAGHDRRVIADAIVLKHRIDAQELQNFAEQEGNINSPWAVIENDKAELPGFPTRLRPAVDEFAAIYFGHVRTARQQILDALARGARPPLSARQWLGLSDQGLVAISRISTTAFALSRAKVAEALAQADREFDIALALMGLSISLALFTLFYVILRVIKPLRAITVAMQSVASGHLDHPVPFQDRRDEIGQFSRALGLFRDNVIEKRRLEEELRDNQIAKGTAEASSKVKSQFLANMSHELRTPLNAIIGFSDLLQNQMFGPLQKQYQDYATIIHESGNHLLNLVSDLLDIAKIEAGRFVLDFQPIELDESVAYCLRLIKSRADERGVRLVSLLPDQRISFSADQRAFRQILINLLSNAVKFSRPGGEVEVSATVAGQRLSFSVRDHGIGMSEGLLSRVGRPFEQAINDPVHARQGTGLGLSLVRALVLQHGGTLEIESHEGRGTLVTCDLPLAQAMTDRAA